MRQPHGHMAVRALPRRHGPVERIHVTGKYRPIRSTCKAEPSDGGGLPEGALQLINFGLDLRHPFELNPALFFGLLDAVLQLLEHATEQFQFAARR